MAKKSEQTLKKLGMAGIVPVVVLNRREDALPLAGALLKGGVQVMEITLRTRAGLGAIAEAALRCPTILVGAGTVLSVEQCKMAADNGACFVVSPGFNAEVVDWCVAHDLAVVPGCVTPTEITMASEKGLEVVKFFPANIYGGLPAMKALSGPFPSVRFVPTGGVNNQNIGEYAAAPYIHAVGGSWLCPEPLIERQEYEKITTLCQNAVQGFIATGREIKNIKGRIEETT